MAKYSDKELYNLERAKHTDSGKALKKVAPPLEKKVKKALNKDRRGNQDRRIWGDDN